MKELHLNLKNIDKKTKVIISIFAGRMADAGKNPLPEFKFVVVVFQDRIIMAESLTLALEGVFGDLEIDLDLDVDDTEDISAIDLLNKASDLFDQAQNALTDGNLGKYQDLIIQVEELVNKALETLNQQ